MLKGSSTLDFNGQDIRGRFETPTVHTPVRGFHVKGLSRLGAQRNQLENGALMENGSVLFTELHPSV